MTPPAAASSADAPASPRRFLLLACRWVGLAAGSAVLAGCAGQAPAPIGRAGVGRYFDPVLGVWASPRAIEDGEAVPRGGGGYLVGRPYTIAGHLYAPIADPRGYVAVGTASWYGDAFHGRRTANGEVFDKGSISAAHPTLPLPSYVRVTNLKNGRSMIVRVNDRGPYHGGRVMDVSQRVAEVLAFKQEGTGHLRIEYIGRAELAGSDDERLLATLTTDGRPARLDGEAGLADGTLPPRPTGPSPLPNIPARIAALPIFRPQGVAPPREPFAPAAAPPPPSPFAARHSRSSAADPFFHPLAAPAGAAAHTRRDPRHPAPPRPAAAAEAGGR